MKRVFVAAVIAAFAAVAAFAQEPVWKIDSAHSSAEFSVRHMMVSKVKGRFGKVSGTVTGDLSKPETVVIDVTIDASSIDTGNENRDEHLRSADFFEVETYPTITFRSKQVEKAGEWYRVTGDLTMHGVTRDVVLDVEGPAAPVRARNTLRSGASATTELDRTDFGVTWNRALDTGGVVVSEEVDVEIEVELVQQVAE